MKAMVFAAGLGTRLRPLTNDRPKALVEINGRTMLELTLTRLRSFEVREVMINVHHFAGMIEDYLKAKDNFGLRIEISREEILLDTGGGLKKAAPFFVGPGRSDEPFIVHNVDVMSAIDLRRMVQSHKEHRPLVTLAVQERKTSRYLMFDDQLRLCGRKSGLGAPHFVRECEQPKRLAFSGIHVMSPRSLLKLTETGVFAITDSYLRLAGEGENIIAFRSDEYYWRDLGSAESVAAAADDLRKRIIVV